jgi:hypothetical protein
MGVDTSPACGGMAGKLLYLSGDAKLMSVDVSVTPAFRVGVPMVLFQAPVLNKSSLTRPFSGGWPD